MGATWSRARTTLRRRWRMNLFSAVLVGVVGTAVLFGIAGARRTSSALDRFLSYSRPFHAFVYGAAIDVAAVEALPQVADADGYYYYLMAPSTSDGRPDPALGINPTASTTGRTGRTSERYLFVDGRLAAPDEALEVMVNEQLARTRGLRPGSVLPMWAYAHEQLGAVLAGAGTVIPAGPRFDFRVAGVVRLPQHLAHRGDAGVVYLATEDLYLTPAFARRYSTEVANFNQINVQSLNVRLARGAADLGGFEEAIRNLPGGETVEFDEASEGPRSVAEARRATAVEALALFLFAASVATTGLLIVGQTLARQSRLEADDYSTLQALGMTKRQIVGSVAIQALVVATAGAVLAITLAAILSPLTPVGLARRAEVDPGVAIDVPVLGIGAMLLVVAIVSWTALSTWRFMALGLQSGIPRTQQHARSRLADGLTNLGLPAAVTGGIQMALNADGGLGAARRRMVLTGTAVAVAAVAASLSLAASLDRLFQTPRDYGWNWDLAVGNFNTESLEKGQKLLGATPGVVAFSAVRHAQVRIQGHALSVAGLGQLAGLVTPEVLAGRLPVREGEIALGPRTLERFNLDIGDRVDIQSENDGPPASLSVVGSALVGHPVLNGLTGEPLGEGGITTLEGLQALVGAGQPAVFLVDLAEGIDQNGAIRRLQADWGKTVLRPMRPDRVENLRRVARLPLVFAALLVLLGVATLGHSLATAVRRHRRDLAVLKVIGFGRGQVRTTVAAQATTIALLAVGLGLPLGVIAGRWAWTALAQGIGTPGAVVAPLLPLAATVPASLFVANVIAVIPGRVAANIRPSVALREE